MSQPVCPKCHRAEFVVHDPVSHRCEDCGEQFYAGPRVRGYDSRLAAAERLAVTLSELIDFVSESECIKEEWIRPASAALADWEAAKKEIIGHE